ncbi:MAG TPA: hypothetical protein VFC65_16645 [Prolixibacteraceae bacterium]|nr:hypothetical protein [Prolixibacteraceae bacterium]
MKKLPVLSITAMFVLAFLQLPAQDVKKEIKAEIKTEKTDVKGEKRAIKIERKELRKLEGISIPKLTKDAFYSDFGDVPNVKWKRDVYLDEAVFTKGGKEMKAYYDVDSKLVGTTCMKIFADLPVNAQKEIKARYKDYTIGNVVFFEDNEVNESDMMLWGTPFDDADNYFVELSKADNHIVLQVNPEGVIFFFKKI